VLIGDTGETGVEWFWLARMVSKQTRTNLQQLCQKIFTKLALYAEKNQLDTMPRILVEIQNVIKSN